MKKIYMILAAMTLLSMSLNAQRLPAKLQGTPNFTPTGHATLVQHNGQQLRLPTLADNEYLFGPYTTDEFDATGVGFYNYINQAQWITSTVMMTQEEYEEHLGDEIIGFRFALAGSSTVRVRDFGIYPTSAEWFANDQYQVWNLGELGNSGGSEFGDGTVTVGTGTVYDVQYLPVYGWYNDYGYQNQMIYSASQLGLTPGSQINSITFYPRDGFGINFAGGTVVVKVGNTDVSNFGTNYSASKITPTDLTTVATITPVNDANATEWVITFDNPFTYTGANLLVQVEHAGGSYDYAHSYFYGDNQSSNVSLYDGSRNALQNTTGYSTSFLPKATFAFTGSTVPVTAEYLELAPGQWHDFYLDEPVELNFTGDSIVDFMMGYSYYQEYSSSFNPVAVSSNHTGHSHYDYMTAYSSSYGGYRLAWWGDGVSGSASADRAGDMAVQLIFRSAMEKTPSPAITYTYDGGTYYITATATDPNATVTLTLSNGATATGTGSVTIPVGRTDSDYTIDATATAQEEGKAVSNPTTESILIPATALPATPTPTIDSQVLDVTVEVTGTGVGEVHMYIDGQEVTSPYYLERTDEDYYVTVVVTAQQDNEHRMTTTTEQVLVPKLTDLDLDGWNLLPGTYNNNDVIIWSSHMMFVDRFTASTAENNHAPKYNYVMTENKTDGRSTNTHIIPVMKTGSVMKGYYTLDQINADTDTMLTMRVMDANAKLYLEQSSEIYYYTLDRSVNSYADDSYIELSKLQRNLDNSYREMGNYFKYGELFEHGAIERLDSAEFDGLHQGVYNLDYMTYVPIVWTFGNEVTNMRTNWENDHKHNSYGSPIWQTAAGKCEIISSGAERQIGKYGSTNWKDENGNPCSLYMLTIDTKGWLPANTNVPYRPYMFRVFVASKSGQLRGYNQVLTPGTDPENTGEPGSHLENNPDVDRNLWCVWDANVEDFDYSDGTVHYQKAKSNTWADNIMFGALDTITDLKVFVRFYYIVDDATVTPTNGGNGLYAMRGDGPGGGGAQSPGGGFDPEPSTAIIELWSDNANHGEVVSTTYVNAQGMQSSKPFDGLNIVIKRYSDGTTSTTKIVK